MSANVTANLAAKLHGKLPNRVAVNNRFYHGFRGSPVQVNVGFCAMNVMRVGWSHKVNLCARNSPSENESMRIAYCPQEISIVPAWIKGFSMILTDIVTVHESSQQLVLSGLRVLPRN